MGDDKNLEVTPAEVKPAEATPGAVVGAEQAPPKTFSEEDWKQKETEHQQQLDEIKVQLKSAQDGYKGTLDKLKADLKSVRSEGRKAHTAEFLRKVKEADGDESLAQRLVELEDNLTSKEQDVTEREATLVEREQKISASTRKIIASEIADKYKVELKEVLAGENPEQMENIALRLKVSQIETQQVPAQKVAPSAGSASGVDWSKLTAHERMVRAIELNQKQ